MAPKKAPAKTAKEKATVLVAVSNGKKVYITPTQARNMANANRNRTDAQGRSGFGATRSQVAASSTATPSVTTYKGQTINWDTPGTRRPTEAFTRPGQKATGLAKSTVSGNRFSSTAKTKLSTGPFANSGNPNSRQFNVTPGNVANAALTVLASPASVGRGAVGPVTSLLSKKAQQKTGGYLLPILSRGPGGGVGRLMPSTLQRAATSSFPTGNDVIRGVNMAGRFVRYGALGGIVTPQVAPKNKKKK
jgi:hypothetical protein